MLRLIDDVELEEQVRGLGLLSGEGGLAELKGYAAFRRWLAGEPEACFVGSTAAAELLGIPAPHIARLRKNGRLPAAIDVEGGYPVYLRSEILGLARELAWERQARLERRRLRDGQTA